MPSIDREDLARVLWDGGESVSGREPLPWSYILEKVEEGGGDYAEIAEIHYAQADAAIIYLTSLWGEAETKARYEDYKEDSH